MSMDDQPMRVENGFIVVIVHIYRKMKMKSTAMNQSLCPSPALSERRARRNALSRGRDTLKLYWERWIRRYSLRHSLYEMDTQLIEKDIGVPYGSLAEEAHKPFWQD